MSCFMQLKFQKKTSLLRPKCCLHQHFKHGRLLVMVEFVVERKEEGRVKVFYLCPQALIRGRGWQKKYLTSSGGA